MASELKKRKTTDRASSDETCLSKEELHDKLSGCRNNKIGMALLDSIQTATPVELRAIQSLLAPLLESITAQLHCVRCHKQYTEPTNYESACAVEHGRDADSEKIGVGMYRFTFSCCGEVVENSSFDLSIGDFCFVGSHTTDEEEVDYYDEESDSGNLPVL
ncbi:hypothetical protein FRC09_005429 [Ceratobasidium sp. 395]|nr:hypothetical protein FRC09_005429 [Ceratobasidium sp. 395]